MLSGQLRKLNTRTRAPLRRECPTLAAECAQEVYTAFSAARSPKGERTPANSRQSDDLRDPVRRHLLCALFRLPRFVHDVSDQVRPADAVRGRDGLWCDDGPKRLADVRRVCEVPATRDQDGSEPGEIAWRDGRVSGRGDSKGQTSERTQVASLGVLRVDVAADNLVFELVDARLGLLFEIFDLLHGRSSYATFRGASNARFRRRFRSTSDEGAVERGAVERVWVLHGCDEVQLGVRAK